MDVVEGGRARRRMTEETAKVEDGAWTLREASVQATRGGRDRGAQTTRRAMVHASERCADETFGRAETETEGEGRETFARELEEALRGCEEALSAKNAGGRRGGET
jgi:hypothetical protein|tara:strand:+ start:79 stop:396 length:318 start_codon:yes stop_codon:yes gene_type:complete